jgi:shikimate kinase
MDFADVDLLIQNKYKKTLASMIAEEGNDAFKKKEEEVLS